MIKRVSRCLIAAFFFVPVFAQADSPITSISFAEGYDLKDLDSHDRDLIVRELAFGDSPLGEKLAVAAHYPDKEELVGKLSASLQILESLRERPELLLILAYAMMTSNPNDVDTPRLVLALAYPDYSDRQSLLMLESLVQGQEWLDSDDWGKIYLLVTQYHNLESSLVKDIDSPVTKEFLRYLALYEKYCEDCDSRIGPSFSCSNESGLSLVEKQICDSSRLSRADRVLTEIYSFVRSETSIRDVKTGQLDWLGRRSRCADEVCISSEYSGRIKSLVDRISVDQTLLYIESIHQGEPQTMLEIQEAEKIRMETAYEGMNVYLAEALTTEPEQQNSIRKAQEFWKKYAEAHCDSVYERWNGGSIRLFEYYRCHKELALHRTHVIWDSYLTYADSTPPVLPDPR